MPRAQALSEILFQNSRSLRSPLAFSPFLKTTAAKQHTPSTRRNGKDLVTGRTCSTTAQAYSLSSLPPASYLTHTSVSPLLSSALSKNPFLAASAYHLFPPVGFSSKLPSPTLCRFVPPHRPSYHCLPPSLN